LHVNYSLGVTLQATLINTGASLISHLGDGKQTEKKKKKYHAVGCVSLRPPGSMRHRVLVDFQE